MIIGSFLNVVIYRLPKNLSLWKGQSFCPYCKKKIFWYDNIPLLSYLLLKGKCRFCQKKISLRYPLVELLTGILFILGYLSHLRILDFILISGLIVIFFIDLEHEIIPDQIIFPAILLFFFFFLITNHHLLITNYLPSAFISALFFYLLHLLTKGRGMGLGDVKLVFLIGLFFGFPKVVIALYLAFLTGAIVGIILILTGKARFGQAIPFGPFLAFTSLVILFFGNNFLWLVGKYF